MYISISGLACKIGVCTDRQLSYAIAIFTQEQIMILDYQFEYRKTYLDPFSKPLMKIRRRLIPGADPETFKKGQGG